MTVPIRLDTGERLAAECVSAEVISGESRVPPEEVRVQVLPGPSAAEWIARITTISAILEPVVEVSISAGCEQRFMRRFIAFADPPPSALASSSFGAAVATAPVVPSATASARPLAPRSDDAGVSFSGVAAGERFASEPPRVRPRPPSASRGVLEPASSRRTTAQGEVTRAPALRPALVPRDEQVARLLLDVGSGAQLRMDLDEPLMRAPASAMAMASDAAALVGSETSSETDRLALLEKTLADLKKEGQASQKASSGMRARLADAESRSRLLPWLLGLLVLAAAVAVWLALRLRKQSRELAAAPPNWWATGAAPLDRDNTGPVPVPEPSIAGELIDEPPMPPTPPMARSQPAVTPSWSEVSPEPEAAERTVAFNGPFGLESISPTAMDGAAASLPSREVSVEELLDLEQQADFFIALGQEDAAVDLLMSHLRSTGGLSPLPYTKLLEIYKRQGDRGAYERIRARFNRRFNAYAPHWDIGPLQGRALEEYAEVMQYLQSIWPSPIDAMAVLEAMLFRKDETQDLFDLPAYKDVLLLYSLARDLWQQGGGTGAEVVDVLLPLGDASGMGDSGRIPLNHALPQHEYDLTAFELAPRVSTQAVHGMAGLDDAEAADLDLPLDLPDLPPPKRN